MGKSSIKIPRGWRKLRKGTIVKSGDQLIGMVHRNTIICISTIGMKVGYYWGKDNSDYHDYIFIRKIKS